MNQPSPFTENQIKYAKRCLHSWFNVAEGGKRGSKNVLQTWIFCSLLETHQNRIHLIGGVSTATARLNILDCDGFGLLNFFEGRCRAEPRLCICPDKNWGKDCSDIRWRQGWRRKADKR